MVERSEARTPNTPDEQLVKYINSIVRVVFTNKDKPPYKKSFREMSGFIRNPNAESINAFAESYTDTPSIIAEQFPECVNLEDKFSRALSMGLAMCTLSNAAKLHVLGDNGSTTVSNALNLKILEQIALGFASANLGELNHDSSIIRQYIELGLNIIDNPNPIMAWYGPKIVSFCSSIMRSKDLLNSLENQEKITEQMVEELKHDNDEIFEKTRQLQKYGVKSAIAPVKGYEPIQEWLVQPKSELLEKISNEGKNKPELLLYNSLLSMFLASDSPFKSSQPTITVDKSKDGNIGLKSISFEDLFENGTHVRSFSIQLMTNGELSLTSGSDIKNFCYENNAGGEYEQLRAQILRIYFDLVTPVYVQDLVTLEEKDLTPLPKFDEPQENQFDKLKRLVLARIRILDILGNDIEEQMEREIEEEQAMTAKRSVRSHAVVDHIRRLPKGYRASQRARDLCFEHLGIVLPDTGETYVQRYEPKNIPQDSGHKIVFSRGEVADQKKRINPKKVKKGKHTPPKQS